MTIGIYLAWLYFASGLSALGFIFELQLESSCHGTPQLKFDIQETSSWPHGRSIYLYVDAIQEYEIYNHFYGSPNKKLHREIWIIQVYCLTRIAIKLHFIDVCFHLTGQCSLYL